MSDAMFAELIAVIGMANETNRLVNGYQVEIDERSPRRRSSGRRASSLRASTPNST